MTIVIHNHSLVTSAEQLPVIFVRSIEALGIDAVDVPHAAGDVAVRGMEQQMVMVRHEAVGRNFEIKHFNGFIKDGDENFIVLGREEYLLSSPAPVHNVIPGAWIFYA